MVHVTLTNAENTTARDGRDGVLVTVVSCLETWSLGIRQCPPHGARSASARRNSRVAIIASWGRLFGSGAGVTTNQTLGITTPGTIYGSRARRMLDE
jgi:hypothetical protein